MILPALLLFMLAGLALAWLTDRSYRRPLPELTRRWLDLFLLPLGRVLVLLLFIVCAYPALFGAPQVPSLSSLLAAEHGRVDRLITVLFVAGLLLPSIPGTRQWQGLVLPLQGMAGIALLASWLAAAQGVPIALWPSTHTWLLLAVLATLAVTAAHLLAAIVEDPVLRQDVAELMLLWLQAPVLLVYGHTLGKALLGAS
jgi:hypothetical protein